MKKIEIFIIGKYEYKTEEGTWINYLNYKNSVIKRSGFIEHAGSPNRVALYSLNEALSHIKEPCQILVHSKAPLGFKNPKASSNKNLIFKILQLINNRGHIVEFDTTNDFSIVDTWEKMYGNKKVEKEENKQHQKIKEPNDIFKISDENKATPSDWRTMYSDLMCDSNDKWVPGSGGY